MSKLAELKFIPDCDINRLKVYDRNPRVNDAAVPGVAASIEAFGFISPIIVDKDFRICVGHTRLKAALEKNLKTVPVIVAPHLTGDKFIGYNIADNQTATKSEWEIVMLASIVDELDAAGISLSSVGFEKDELEELLASLENGDPVSGITDPDDVPEPPKKPITKKGDIWSLGNHRLYCGDCTVQMNVEKLMNGQKADMLFTDPPYNVGKNYDGENLNEKEFNDFHRKALSLMKRSIRKDGACYICFGSRHLFEYADLIREFFRPRLLIWYKPDSHGVGGGDFFYNFESIFYGSVSGSFVVKNYSGEARDVWIINKARESGGGFEHPTVKPVAVPAAAIETSSNRNHIILDVFLGSGSTLIACEQFNRKCYAMEIDPMYCDVTIKRWEAFTGKKAVKTKT